jgi:hypothetical protein
MPTRGPPAQGTRRDAARPAPEVSSDGLTYRHNACMVFHMKTTLIISDATMIGVKQEAARQGRTISELVEAALRAMLQKRPAPGKLPPLPTFRAGAPRVDVANRNALHDLLEP